jgi:hypothetical protein
MIRKAGSEWLVHWGGTFPVLWAENGVCGEVDSRGARIQALRHYRYEADEKLGGLREEPLHEQYSHEADAFRTAAVMIANRSARGAGEAQAGGEAESVELRYRRLQLSAGFSA